MRLRDKCLSQKGKDRQKERDRKRREKKKLKPEENTVAIYLIWQGK